jgi:hypothetical protein
MDRNEKEQAIRLHECLDFIGLRAQATSVGLLQLCTELVAVGVLDGAAVERIKRAIQKDITISRRGAKHGQDEFESTLRKRLDSVFPSCEAKPGGHVGTALDLQEAMSPPN